MLSVRNGSGGEGTAEGTASKPPKVVQEVSATQIFLCISIARAIKMHIMVDNASRNVLEIMVSWSRGH